MKEFARQMEIQSCCDQVNGQHLHYLHAGAGRPLLLIHGLLGGSFCWRFNLPVLAQRHSVYALDLPGMGLSDAQRDCNCSMQAQADRVLEFIEHEKMAEVDVIGSSWGGAVSLLMAVDNPKIRSLILCAPVNPWSTLGSNRICFFTGLVGSMLLRYGLRYGGRYHRPALEAMYGDRSRIPPGTLEGYGELIQRKGRGHNLLNILQNWKHDVETMTAVLPRVSARCLLIWGTHDRAVDPRSATLLQEAIPSCRTVMVDSVGHLPFEEDPEVFNRLALDFLNEPEHAMGN